jgi:uncharacterized protein YjiS (DUF1127 family)
MSVMQFRGSPELLPILPDAETAMPAVTSLIIAAAALSARAVLAAGAGAVRRLKQFAQALKNRRRAAILTGLDDRMLSDIGLTRSDLRDAYAEPLWHDPTDVLASRAAERRVCRQRSTCEAR